MNYLKIGSIANLQIGKRQIEKRFAQNQSQANRLIKQNHMANYNYNQAQQVVGISKVFIPDGKKVKFGENTQNSKIQGKILEEQLMLKSLESEYDLEKSRIEDANNAKTFRIRYPYGKENVRITQDVLQKYKVNRDQISVLKKFEQQAKQRKQQKKSQKRLQLQAYRSPYIYENASEIIQRGRQRKVTSILERQKKKMQMAKQQYLREVQKSKELQREENKRIENIEAMLKGVREKMEENFSLILQNQDQKQRNRRFVRQVDTSRARLQKMRAVDRLQATQRSCLPVVVYKNSRAKEQNFINRSLCLDMMEYERPLQLDKPQEFEKVLKIYSSNKDRLDRLCQRIAVKENAGDIVF